MKEIEIMSNDFDKEVISSDKTVLVDFYANWCSPCKMMAPIIGSIADENENIKVVKVDIDKNQDLAIKYDIMSIPTIMIFKNGVVTKNFIGVTDKSEIEKEL